MNQDILFNEGAQWHATEQRVEFTAQQLGALIRCFISHGQLEQLAGEPLLSEQAILSAFERLRFDVEERAEELIEAQEFAEDGAIYL